MSWLEALIMGLVQGLTEFLPVSSSGHLAIAQNLLGVNLEGDAMISFDVVVHAATALATILVFWKPIVRLLGGLLKFRYNDETDYVCKIIVSMIPVFVVGMFLKDKVEAVFSSFIVVGICLLVTALLLLLSDSGKLTRGTEEGSSSRNGISFPQALIVGLGQALAVLPGLSRSGTTISTGLLCGVKRSVVAEFSFLMVIVPILGEAFLGVVGGEFSAHAIGTLPILVGFASAFLSGLFACKVMIALVKKAKLKWFALYCAIAGIAVIASCLI